MTIELLTTKRLLLPTTDDSYGMVLVWRPRITVTSNNTERIYDQSEGVYGTLHLSEMVRNHRYIQDILVENEGPSVFEATKEPLRDLTVKTVVETFLTDQKRYG